MTEKEIVQALRYCKFGVSCENCPAVGNEDCFDEVNTAAADLIERLTAENAALREKKRWISVTEKTPEYDMPQLALNADGDALIANYAYGEWFDTWGARRGGHPLDAAAGSDGGRRQGMSKAVLISIRPMWSQKIMSGQKTVEVRKTRPKMNPPFKCYIYKCGNGKVIGEFLCDEIIEDRTYGHNEEFYRAACMSAYDAAAYAMQSPMYGWHISDLRVYDHPRDLWEFTGLRQTRFGWEPVPITRPPQSWRYVEEELWKD